MTKMDQTAKAFFDAVETGKGWDGCKAYCTSNATFSCQADALADVRTIQAYADWMKGLFGPIPDGTYTLKAWGVDPALILTIAAILLVVGVSYLAFRSRAA